MPRRPRRSPSPDTRPDIPSFRVNDRYSYDSVDSENSSDRDSETSPTELEQSQPRAKEPNLPAHHTGLSEAGIQSAGYIVIYYVLCSGRGIHRGHAKAAAYLDHPRMFKGDSKMSALRGTETIEDTEEFLEKRQSLNFIVSKSCSCETYHKEIESLFDPLPMPQDPEVPDSVHPYFFSLRRHGAFASISSESLNIVSQSLRKAVFAATGITTEHVSKFRDAWNIHILPQVLYHYHRLHKSRHIPLSTRQRRLLEQLIDYMEWHHKDDYKEADQLFAQGLITLPHLPKLYGLNDVLVTNAHTQPCAYLMEQPPKTKAAPLLLKLWSWEFDGKFRRKETEKLLDWPMSASAEEVLPITSLDIYPLRYAASGVEKRLRSRGRIFWECRKTRFVAYDPPNPLPGIQMSYPRYMVDASTYRQMHGASEDVFPSHGDELDQNEMDKSEPPDGHFLLLLPYEVFGFGFNDKKWRTLLVERIKEIDWNDEAFDRLVMQHHKKELIKALVTVHTTSVKSTDIIEGKGNSLIILLHGGPGTGKTLTAESVAELTRKPLYRVTCGDIGTNADEVEKYLDSVLLLGTIWGCVVLLDEADVFLEERRETDLQRNALVSVFLRVLEYYHGILILTSNRIGTFDAAFKSRFQLAVHYPALDVKGRFEIWFNFINGLRKTLPDVDIDGLKDRINDLSEISLNGRQIRNTVQTALQLADFRKEVLNYQHFDRVIKVIEEFEEHLHTTRGYSELDWIQHQGIRPEP